MHDIVFQTITALVAGGIVGFTLGLIGGGGSILATPLLIYLVGVSNPHVALGTGALAVSVNAYLNFAGHARKGHVRWRCAMVFAGLGTVGALIGSTVGMAVDGKKLLFLFGVLMLLVAGLMARKKAPTPGIAEPVAAPHICWRTAAVAIATGLTAGFFGIGGGFLIVPGLIFATGMPMINAIGSSLLAVGTFGLATALNYAANGLVDWKVAVEFIGGGIGGGLIGMAMATRLSVRGQLLNQIFAGIVAVVAIYILYRSGLSLLSGSPAA
jgi:uncharacterized protein